MRPAIFPLLLALLALPLLASADQWNDMEATFERGADHARYWQLGWGTFYGGSTVYSLVHARHTEHADDRYDDYINATKTALGFAGTFLFAPPHPEALGQFRQLRQQGDANARASARILLATLAAEEEQQRRWHSRLGGLIVNGLAGLAIGLEDKRPGDGWRNFATGMISTELNVRTRPTTATAFLERTPDFTLRAGGGKVDLFVQSWAAPMAAGVQVRF